MGGVQDRIVIRAPRADEGERLREIAIASKSHWGYEESQVRAWAAQGDFSPAGLAAKDFLVAEADGQAVGFASLIPRGELCVLDDLWLEPAWIGRRLGSELFEACADRAKERGAKRLEWEAEPNAVGFYEKMGACYLRDSEPTEFGRVIPVMGLDLG
jgi:GNAT superfamily N-acetyltransferase